MAEPKPKTPWLVQTLIGLLLGAYAFIYGSLIGDVSLAEAKIELNKQNIDNVLLQIQNDISAIQRDIEWLKKEPN